MEQMRTGEELLQQWDAVASISTQKQVTIAFGDIVVLEDGEPVDFSEEIAKAYLEQDLLVINVTLKEGTETGTAWGCDLTYDYVKINASYRS